MAIAAEDDVLRIIKTAMHVVRVEDGGFEVSSQLWTSMEGGCSVELRSLLIAANAAVDDRISSQNGIGASEVGVGAVRSTMNRIDQKTKQEIEQLGLAYTPIAADQPYGPNPYHCDIFPKLGNPGRNKLHGKAILLSLDQTKAKALWETKHGITPASGP